MGLSKNLHFLARQLKLALSLEEAQKEISQEFGVRPQIGGPLGELSFRVSAPRDQEEKDELENKLLELGKKLEEAWPNAQVDFLNPPGYYRMTIKNIPEQMEEIQNKLQESVDLLLNVVQDSSSGFQNTRSEIKNNRIILRGTMGGSSLYLKIVISQETEIEVVKGDVLMFLHKASIEELYDPSYWDTLGRLLDLAGDDDSVKLPEEDIQRIYHSIWPGNPHKVFDDPEFPIEGIHVSFGTEADEVVRVVMFDGKNYIRYYLKEDPDQNVRELYEILDLFKRLG